MKYVLMAFNILTGPYVSDGTEFTAVTFPYILDDFQKHAIHSIEKNHHIIVPAPTGCGKTTVGEYAIHKAVSLNKKVIYTTPIKALSNQIFNDLQRKYPTLDVGIRTGDIEINPDAQVLIMTTEILRNELFRGDKMDNVSHVVYDEAHWIKDRDRGHVWEQSFLMMPDHVHMTMLSATLPDADELGKWLAITKNHDVDLAPSSKRVVPLTHYIMGYDKLYEIMDNNGHFNNSAVKEAVTKFDFKPSKLNEYIMRLQKLDDLPAFFFCFSRDKCEAYANSISISLVDGKTATEISNIFDRNIKQFGERYIGLKQVDDVKKLLMKGVCYHHAGLMHVLKEIIEIIFAQGYIKILFVTETFAAGVNMPARTVVFTSLQKPSGSNSDSLSLRPLYPEEYMQMAGRAGRRGLDIKGTVIILPFHPRETLDAHSLSSTMCGKMANIVSRFKIDYQLVLKVILSNDTIDHAISLISFSESSLLNQQVHRIINLIKDDIAQLDRQFSVVSYLREIINDEKSFIARYIAVRNSNAKQNKLRSAMGKLDTEKLMLSITEQKKIDKMLKDYDTYCELEHKLKATRDDLEYQESYITTTIRGILKYLFDSGYMNSHEKETFIYLRENLTIKGLIASEISECNSLLLTEIITGTYFDELTTAEIISVLAIFIDEREVDREFEWQPAVGRTIKSIETLITQLQKKEDLQGIADIDTDWTIYAECVDLAYAWASGCDITQIYKMTNMHEGNFVKAILKLRKICETIVKSCELLQNNTLRKKLENHETLLVRSIVTPESLYIKTAHKH